MINAGLLVAAIGLAAGVAMRPEEPLFYWGLVLASSALGILVVIPIGGADMPVVISLLNSYSGLAACADRVRARQHDADHRRVAGRALGDDPHPDHVRGDEPVAGQRPVRRPGARRSTGRRRQGEDIYAGRVKSADPEEIAMLLDIAQRVVIVPGYGLAVSQAQHAVRDLADLLESRASRSSSPSTPSPAGCPDT